MSLRMTDERAQQLRHVMQATGENTKAKALDIVMNHSLADFDNKHRYADDLDGKMAENFSTPWMPIERETRGGRTDD